MATLLFSEVETPDGVGVLEKIYVTDLGLVMGKIFYPNRKVWINYQLSNLDELLSLQKGKLKIKLKGKSNLIFKRKVQSE